MMVRFILAIPFGRPAEVQLEPVRAMIYCMHMTLSLIWTPFARELHKIEHRKPF